MLLALKGNIIETKEAGKLLTYPNSYLVLEDGRVLGIEKVMPGAYREAKILDFGDSLILQSFLDMHLHGPQYEMCGVGMDMPLLQWLETYAFPTESRYRDTFYAREKYKLLAKALVKNGTTRVCMFGTLHTDSTLILMEELEKAGLTGFVGKVNMDRNAPPYLIETTEESIRETERWLKESLRFTKIKPILTPRFAPSCSGELLSYLGKVKAKWNLPVQSHLSENLSEIKWVKELFPDCGQYWEVYDKYGLFDSKTLMAHCVHSDGRERQAMRDKGVYPVHCADSNNALISGMCPAKAMLQEGQNLCIGTDVAGGCSLSMINAVHDALRTSRDRRIASDFTEASLTAAEGYYLASTAAQPFFGAEKGFAPGELLHAVVLDDSRFGKSGSLSLSDRLGRCFSRADDRDVKAVFSEGKKIL